MNARIPTLALAALCACLSLPTHAAEAKGKAGAASAEAQAQYKRDLAACDGPNATQDRATCRVEAQRALAEARSGNFSGSQDQYSRNARERCNALKDIERTACEQRMSGAGSTSGSVGGGGISRQNTVTVPAK